MERITVQKTQLTKSGTLNEAGKYVLVLPEYPDEEQIFLGICSEPVDTEEQALKQLEAIEMIYTQGMKGDKVYLLGGEIKVWSDTNAEGNKVFVAYEQICFPGVTAERALELRAAIFS
jgi:hypothetical protein